MKYVWIHSAKDFLAVASQWDEALKLNSIDNPFLLSEFILTWWKHFGKTLKLSIFAVFDGDRIVGGLPLYLRKGSYQEGFARVLHYVGGSAANYTEPFFTPAAGNILEQIYLALNRRNDWDVLYLSDIRGESRFLADYRSNHIDSNGNVFALIQDHSNWSIDLSMGEEQYFASRSKKMMKDLKAKRKHAVKDYGPLKLVTVSGEEAVNGYFTLYQKFSLHAFKERKRSSSFENARYAEFFRDFLIYMDSQQRLNCQVLFAGETVLAISFAYRYGKGFNWVLTGFNYSCKYVRPGYLLIEELIKDLLAKKETIYNWYGYERFYKEQWCNTTEPLYKLYLIKKSMRGALYKGMRCFERSLRAHPWFVSAVKKVKGS